MLGKDCFISVLLWTLSSEMGEVILSPMFVWIVKPQRLLLNRLFLSKAGLLRVQSSALKITSLSVNWAKGLAHWNETKGNHGILNLSKERGLWVLGSCSFRAFFKGEKLTVYKLANLLADNQLLLSLVDSVWQNRELVRTNDCQVLWNHPGVSPSISFHFLSG